MAQTQSQGPTTVVGVFEDYSAAERASRQLVEEGIPRDSIQIQSNFRTGTAGGASDASSTESHSERGFMGWWHSLFNDDDDARAEGGHYAEAVRRGSAVLSVSAPANMVDRTTDIMNSAGALDVDERASGWRESGYTGYDANSQPYSHEQATEERDQFRGKGSGEQTTVPVVQEELQIGKRAVKRGGVRVYSRLVERPANEQITLREEHVRVERRPVDRAISDAEMNNLRDQSIEVTETVEEAVIGKRARVTEEVVVGKETSERTQQVNDTVRHTEIQVDRIDGNENAGNAATSVRGKSTTNSGAIYDTDSGTSYDSSAYQYGSQVAGSANYKNRSWQDVESDIRSDYSRNNPGSEWEKVKASIRRGWDDVTGKR